MSFNVEKCKVMHFGKGNKSHEYYPNNKPLTKVTQERDIGITVTSGLKSYCDMHNLAENWSLTRYVNGRDRDETETSASRDRDVDNFSRDETETTTMVFGPQSCRIY